MKRILSVIIMSLLCVTCFSQISVGIRDNRHVYGQYVLKKKYSFKLEQSVYAEKLGYQTLRGYIGYRSNYRGLVYSAEAYLGSTYNGSYYTTGGFARGRYAFVDRLFVDVALNPHYDSTIGYETCFAVGAGFVITRDIDIVAGYTTVPEYRLSEKRVQGGFDFHVAGLTVSPRLSIGTSGVNKAKTLRALMSFSYEF